MLFTICQISLSRGCTACSAAMRKSSRVKRKFADVAVSSKYDGTSIKKQFLTETFSQKTSIDTKFDNNLAADVRRGNDGFLIFPDFPDFRPNRTPKEVLQAGAFGGTYFRNIKSRVTNQMYKDAWKEFPSDWFDNLNIDTQIASQIYKKDVNKYKVKCGASLDEWEGSGWIKAQDPYGWFQWYCRFFLGRRTTDDTRQIGRWRNFDGRFKNNLLNQIRKANSTYDDYKISPAIRQSLLHWGIEVTYDDTRERPKKSVNKEMKKRLIDLVPLT